MNRLLVAVALSVAVAGPIRAQMFEQQTIGVGGRPFAAVFSPDAKFIFVGTRNGRTSALDVLALESDGKWKKTGTIGLGESDVQGILPVPGTNLLAVGLGAQGIGLIPLNDAEKATGKVAVLSMGKDAGAGLLSVSRDGKVLYAGDEYGNGGQVTQVSLTTTEQHTLQPKVVAHVETPRVNAGIFVSPDGTRAYATTEVVPQAIRNAFEGQGNSTLDRAGCTQGGPRSMPGGGLYVIDTVTHQVVAKFLAGCSPVRDLVSPDGKMLYVNARGDNQLLAFDTAKLESDPGHAFVWSAKTGGTAPVGIALFDGGTKMLVANSNRFTPGAPGTITALDLKAAGGPKVVETVKAGDFPRNIDTAPDGRTLAVTIFGSSEVMVLRMK